MTIHCNGMWWPPTRSLGGFLNSIFFMTVSGLTLYNFLSSMYHGPGYLPANWKPVCFHFKSKYTPRSNNFLGQRNRL
jgi:hypothetical protein